MSVRLVNKLVGRTLDAALEAFDDQDSRGGEAAE
jgi:hypothetical protein